MIFQDPFASLNPRMTIGEIISEPIVVHDGGNSIRANKKVIKLLHKVGLNESYAKRYPHELSGGQRQRIGIARALALEPKLIIADEAVSALDVSIQAQVVNLLMELQEEYGLSYLFISHDMAVVERVSHKVAVMYLGEIVELGTRSQVFENPQHPYTKKLMMAVPVADPKKRKKKLNLMTDEIPSLLKPFGFEPEIVELTQISENHFVRPFEGMKI
jgi:glutathione transport system ATP-binding protein